MLGKVVEFFRYRITNRMHVVKTGMEPGYVDVTERMLHVNFNMLKDFVEIEKAQMWKFCGMAEDMEQPGVSYLVSEMGLLDEEGTSQAADAREIYDLYNWWTNQRPYRVEDNIEDWDAYQSLSKEIYGDYYDLLDNSKDTSELRFLRKTWLNNSVTIERNNLLEDDRMLIRLVKIRAALWT